LLIKRYLEKNGLSENWNLDFDFYMSKIQNDDRSICDITLYWLRSNIHNVRNVHYRFSVLAVNIGT